MKQKMRDFRIRLKLYCACSLGTMWFEITDSQKFSISVDSAVAFH